MIAGPWRGDTVIYVGDYWTGSSFDDERSHRLFAKFDGYPYEDILKRFENVTGRFEEARGHKYGDYLHFEERGDVFDEPYTGPFDLRVRSWRYAVNRTRREFVDRRQGPVFGTDDNARPRRCGRFSLLHSDTKGNPDGRKTGWCAGVAAECCTPPLSNAGFTLSVSSSRPAVSRHQHRLVDSAWYVVYTKEQSSWREYYGRS